MPVMLWSRLRALWRRHQHQSDLDDEIRFHLEEEADARRAVGLSPEQARRAARREFGNVLLHRESARETWGWSGIERLVQDVRYALRALRAAPLVTAAATVSLALGIGANTAIFSVVDTLILRPLPVDEPDRLVLLRSTTDGRTVWTNPVWEQLRDRPHLADGAFASGTARFNLSPSGESQFVGGLWASGRMFEVLGVRAIVGRTLTERDDRPGGGVDGPVAVISYRFWQDRFNGSPDAIGKTITIERIPFTVVGVTPPRFVGVEAGTAFDVAIPVGTATLIRGSGALRQRSSWWLRIMMRLEQDQTAEAATAALRAIQPQIREATLPDDWHPWTLPSYLADPFQLEPAANGGGSTLRRRYQLPLTTIMAVVALVLVIACANLANLLLARAAARRQELALRIALGASRLRIFRQSFCEALMLAGGGALLGVALAHWSSRLLVRELSTPTANVALDLSLDWRVLAFTTGAALVTAVLFGTAPAWRAARQRPNEVLKSQGRTTANEGWGGSGQFLIIVQVAMSLVLVVAAMLFLRTFASVAGTKRGFDDRQLLIASVSWPPSRIPVAQRPEVFRQLLSSARALPGVSSVALSNGMPLGNSTWNNVVDLIDGPTLPPAERLTYFNLVSPGWFETYGTRILAGRDFTTADTLDSLPVAIVNDAFARRFTAGKNPIGVRVRHPGNIVREIVGLVEDVAYESLRDPVPPTLYVSVDQDRQLPGLIRVNVRTAGVAPALLIKPLAAAIGGINRDLVITARPLSDNVRGALAQERIVAVLSSVFAMLALLLAAIGLYGLASYAVCRRRAEIGIRLALGAAPRGVVTLILRRVVVLIGVGVAVGTVVSLWAGRLVAPLLFGLEPRDPITMISAIIVLVVIGLIAGWLPAYRASRIDPVGVLRE
jgi:putative ABC transport system permease protein